MNTGDPETVLYRAERRVLKIQTKLYQGSGRPTWGLWRARCGESRTTGLGSGSGKRAGRKTGTAPRTDFTTHSGRIEPSSYARPARNRLSPSQFWAGSGVDQSSVG